MPWRRILVVLAIAAGLPPARAEADTCDLPGPYLGTGPQLPLGCPAHAYRSPSAEPLGPLRMYALRAGAYVDVTGTVVETPDSFTVERTFLDCQLQITRVEDDLEPYEHFEFQLAGVQVGDQIGIGTGWLSGIQIAAAGACAAPMPPWLQCEETQCVSGQPPFDEIQPGGCAAGGGGGLLAGLALLGLIRVCRCHRR